MNKAQAKAMMLAALNKAFDNIDDDEVYTPQEWLDALTSDVEDYVYNREEDEEVDPEEDSEEDDDYEEEEQDEL